MVSCGTVGSGGLGRFVRSWKPWSNDVCPRFASVEALTTLHSLAYRKHRAQWWESMEDWSWDAPGLQ
jgi:hypothetical protein